jgi:two-component system nitrate/nitrite response regulator NarL
LRILLADDHHVVREAIVGLLTRSARDIVVTEAWTLGQAVEKVQANSAFDLIILDYNMPGMNGLAGLEAMRTAAPHIPVAILSGQITEGECLEALDRGAAGVVLKDLHGTALLGALRTIAAGETYAPSAILQAREARSGHGVVLDREQRHKLGDLTPRELQCIRLLIRGSTNKQIAEMLTLAEVTVKLHLHSAFKKMGARNRSDAVRIAMLKGLTAL